ncbi:MAG: hypothetical protein KKF33_10960 [Alphaproteobacteria bacterium]|nr:hypothetical protein [Alphaproteobacteria bacterium]
MLRKLWSLLQRQRKDFRLPPPENIVRRALVEQQASPVIERFAKSYYEDSK